jgi:hypothetical protein
LALTDNNFKFPQTWRSNIAVDRKLYMGWTGTGEFIYNKDVNGIYYINANLPAAQATFTGVDARQRWVGASCTTPTVGPCATRINNASGAQVTDAVVMKNQNIGRSWNVAATLSKTFRAGLTFKSAYSFGEAKNTIDPGSIASGSYFSNQQHGDPNNPGLGFSQYSPGHRVFVATSYNKQLFSFGQTMISAFWEARTIGNSSYVFSGDANGDTGTSNDLLYVPRNTAEMNFLDITGAIPFTAAQQASAWDAYIAQDKYLSKHRGAYAVRNAVFFPLVKRMDLSVAQDLFHSVAGAKHGFQLRMDILNFGNFLNHNWGVSQQMVSNSPLISAGADANGALSYRMRVVSGKLMDHTFDQTTNVTSDVYRFQVTLKYTFN